MDTAPFRFLIRLAAWSLPIALPLLAIETSLFVTGESATAARAHHMQAERGPDSLYGRGLFSQQFPLYKREGLRRHNARLVILGSSRVLALRTDIFQGLENFPKGPAYNAGGLLQDIDGLATLHRMFKHGKLPEPEQVLVCIDPWWLRAAHIRETNLGEREAACNASAHLSAIRQVLLDPKTRSRLLQALRNPISPDSVGIQARTTRRGFRPDGSNAFPAEDIAQLERDRRYVDRESPPIIERVRKRTNRFSLPWIADPMRVRQLQDILSAYQTNGPQIHILFMPFSSDVYAEISTHPDFQPLWNWYTVDFPAWLEANDIPFSKVLRPADAALDDLYMFDGFHAGEVLSAAVLLDGNTSDEDRQHIKAEINGARNPLEL